MRILYVTFFVVLADQISKLLVKGFNIPFLNFTHDGMYHGQRIPIIGDFFQLTFVENPGMAFGISLDPAVKVGITVFSFFACLGVLYYLWIVRNQSFSLRFALSLILGGAIGNLIDRAFYGIFYGYSTLFYGKVVDFLDFDFFNLDLLGRTYDRFPIFNVADSAVTIGVAILLIFYKKHQDEMPSESADTAAIPTVAEENSIAEAGTEQIQSTEQDSEREKNVSKADNREEVQL